MTFSSAATAESLGTGYFVRRRLVAEVFRCLSAPATGRTSLRSRTSTAERVILPRPIQVPGQTSVSAESTEEKRDSRPIWEVIGDIFRDRPKEVLDAMPVDGAVIVPIQTFAPDPYKVARSFQVVVQARGEEFVAAFLDANLSASGATQEEAVRNLKDIIVAVFESLSKHDEGRLGPGPKRQLRVLEQFVERV